MSDADIPPESNVARALCDAVIALHSEGNPDNITVKKVRARAEELLGLRAGVLRANPTWKPKSEDIIRDAFDKYCADDATSEPAPEPTAPVKADSAPKKKQKPAGKNAFSAKRKTMTPVKKPQKRRKAAVSSDGDSDVAMPDLPTKEELSDVSEPTKKAVPRRGRIVVEESDEESNEPKPEPTTNTAVNDEKNTAVPADKVDVSESELSSLIDEPPVKKKRKSAAEKPKKESRSAKTTKARTKPSKAQGDEDPDQTEIKRLQGWLVKCGIRKVWSRELAKCSTPKEKIRHLKGLLKDAGMDGKFSNEKAARIKEQREFAKDLAEIQQGELAWGKQAESEPAGRPRRRLNRGTKSAVVREDDVDEDDNEDD